MSHFLGVRAAPAAVALLPAGSGWCPAAGAAPARHLIYLHGRIVQEERSSRPRHPRFGHYELDRILETFREQGFVVSGGVRPKSATVSESAGTP